MDTASRIKEEVASVLARPYARELIPNEDGTWFARVIEFTGCMTEGDTAEQALENLEDAMASWIEVRLEDQEAIPDPLTAEGYSGKFLMRVPKTLHRELARHADIEGVSLNQFALFALSRAVCGPAERTLAKA